jgi:hypothetical protein
VVGEAAPPALVLPALVLPALVLPALVLPALAAPALLLPPAALLDGASVEPQPTVNAAITPEPRRRRQITVADRMTLDGGRATAFPPSAKRHAGALCCRTVRAAGTLAQTQMM